MKEVLEQEGFLFIKDERLQPLDGRSYYRLLATYEGKYIYLACQIDHIANPVSKRQVRFKLRQWKIKERRG